jgi:hypothetical protein
MRGSLLALLLLASPAQAAIEAFFGNAPGDSTYACHKIYGYEQGDSVYLYVKSDTTKYTAVWSRLEPDAATPAERTVYGDLVDFDPVVIGDYDLDQHSSNQTNFDRPLRYDIPSGAEPGFYQVVITTENDTAKLHYAVRDDSEGSHSVIAILSDDATGIAYDTWGGKSSYGANAGDYFSCYSPSHDFEGTDNNLLDLNDSNQFYMRSPNQTVQFYMDDMGIPFEAISLIDIENDTSILCSDYPTCASPNYKKIIVAGHNEYWPEDAALAIDTWVKAGGHLINGSGNTSWWQSRFDDAEPESHAGEMTIFKDASDPISSDCAGSCFTVADSSKVTNLWRKSGSASQVTPAYEAARLGLTYQYGGYINWGGFTGCTTDAL